MMHKFNNRNDDKSIEDCIFLNLVHFAPAAAGSRRIHPDKASRLSKLISGVFSGSNTTLPVQEIKHLFAATRFQNYRFIWALILFFDITQLFFF